MIAHVLSSLIKKLDTKEIEQTELADCTYITHPSSPLHSRKRTQCNIENEEEPSPMARTEKTPTRRSKKKETIETHMEKSLQYTWLVEEWMHRLYWLYSCLFPLKFRQSRRQHRLRPCRLLGFP